MSKEIRKADLIYSLEVAHILGVSRQTIKNWLHRGYLNDIRKKSNALGLQYHIFDVFSYAHPQADKNTIEMMIFQYRLSKSKDKKASQNRKLRAKKTRG